MVWVFISSKYFKTGKPAKAKSIDPAFVSTGFKKKNGKKKHLKGFPCMRIQRSQHFCYNCCLWKQVSYYTVEQCSQYTASRKQS